MQEKSYHRSIVSAILIALGTSAYAQDDSANGGTTRFNSETPASDRNGVETVYVIGRRIALDAAQEQLDRRAGGTSLVSAESFKDTRATTFSDLLAFAPGVLVQTRHGEETRLSIRGSGIQRGFQLRGIQMYQDGIPLNLADGGGDFQAIDPLAAQYIEIWRGGNALEYGSSTLGGAINFVTPTGHTTAPVAVRLDTGSFGQRRGHLQLGGSQDDLDGTLSVTTGKQDGWRSQSATKADRASASIGYTFSDSLKARVFFNYVDSALELPGSLTLAEINNNAKNAAANYVERDASNDYSLGRGAVRLAWTPVAGAEVVVSSYYSDRDRYHPTIFGILDQNAVTTGIDIRSSFELGGADTVRTLVLGVSHARYDGSEDRFTNVAGLRGTYSGRTELNGDTRVVYGEYSHGMTDLLTLQFGAQHTVAARELINRAVPTGSYDESFDGFSPKLGVLYDVSQSDQLYANVSRSFEPAPFGEARVLPDLPMPDAQKATTYELGWRRRSGNLKLEATAYSSTLDNEFLALISESGVSLGTANADRTVHRGFEFGADLMLTDKFNIRSSYLWSDFRFDDDITFGNNNLAGVPPHSLNAQLSWRPVSWLTISPMLEWRGGKTWIDHANSVDDSGYTLFHLGVSGDLWGSAEWFVDVRNVANNDYISTTLVRDRVNGRDSASYFPGDPRSVYAGVQWHY